MASNKNSGKPSVSIDASALEQNGTTSSTNGATTPTNGSTRRAIKIATVSHTLDAEMAERLRYFAFRERISESAVIEYALGAFFERGDDAELGKLLRDAGAALRRKVAPPH